MTGPGGGGSAGTGPGGGSGTSPGGGAGTGPSPTGPQPTGPKPTFVALWLIPVLVILAAFLLACGMGQASGQSCGEKQISGGASPSYNFSCGVNR